jgi:large subunit ribosomal protein LX
MRDDYSDFTTTVEAVNEDVALEHTLSQIGSRHGLKRTQIEVTEVEAR